MKNQLFESFREWVHLTRRRKDSKKPSRSYILEGARVPCSGGNHYKAVSGEIILGLEPIEFKLKARSSEASHRLCKLKESSKNNLNISCI